MKALSMPAITSPGWQPLKKLSRGCSSRSKSSPIFYRRNAAGMVNTAQEPYSPRVTCIGQVRPRKSGGAAVSRSRGRCSWFMKGKFLSRFTRILCKWVVFFKAGYCKKVDDVGRKVEFLSNINGEIRVRDSCCTDPPPRNALMLTRFGRDRIWRERGEDGGVAESRIGQQSGGDSENPRINVGGLERNTTLVLTRCKSQPIKMKRKN